MLLLVLPVSSPLHYTLNLVALVNTYIQLLKGIFLFRNNFLDQRKGAIEKLIERKCPVNVPVIFLMDNVNIYRGRKRHTRLPKSMGPKMWNFTVRGAIIPDTTDVEELLGEVKTATMSQIDISELKAKDLLLGTC